MSRIIIKPRRALPLFSRHPWVFAGAIARIEGEPAAGAEVDVVTHDGEFIAKGLFNPHSNIRVRLYAWDKGVQLDDAFWRARIESAVAMRRRLPEAARNTARRLIFSEADGLSGLIVDEYDRWLVVQLGSLALAERRAALLHALAEIVRPLGIVLRTEKGIREAEGLELSEGVATGEAPPRPAFIEEHGVRYGVDLVHGQKTGFFLDQSENRRVFAGFTRGGRVLDVCCYTGGFGLAAAVRGDARRVTAVDVSEPALAMAQANAELNGVANRFEFVQSRASEAMKGLKQRERTFDAVALDPPRMARGRSGLKKALYGYMKLNRAALQLVAPGGALVTCSCSGHVSAEQFEDVLAQAALESNRSVRFVERRGASADHPVSPHCRETAYLKCMVCVVE